MNDASHAPRNETPAAAFPVPDPLQLLDIWGLPLRIGSAALREYRLQLFPHDAGHPCGHCQLPVPATFERDGEAGLFA